MIFLRFLKNTYKIIIKIINRCYYFYAVKSCANFISYLRRKGINVGDDCFFQSPKTALVDITRPLLVDIGRHCYFLENFTLLTHDNVSKVFGPVYYEFIPSSGKVTIGNNVYFARNCSVLKNVTIGDNCIIGFGSIVTHDIPSNSVAVGAPAKVICTLDEFYQKRLKNSFIEACNLAQVIFEKTGLRPTVSQMWEEFPFWMEGDSDDKRLKFSVKYQTRGFHDYWIKNHQARFKSFDEFIDYALKMS